jgi:hypothetical protein
VSFDNENCTPSGCDILKDHIGDNCISSDDNTVPIQSFGGFNKLTHTNCDIQMKKYLEGIITATNWIPASSDRKLVFHQNAVMRAFVSIPFQDFTTLPGSSGGIFMNLDHSKLAKNFFYKIKFNTHQIFFNNCPNIETGVVGFPSPTYEIYKKEFINNTDPDLLIHNEWTNNRSKLQTFNKVGQYTPNGELAGEYDSPDFKFSTLDFNEDPYLQIAIISSVADDGLCGNLNAPAEPNEEELQLYYAGLLDDVVIDCDESNISFNFELNKCSPEQSMDCNSVYYCGKLTTGCPNLGLFNFPFKIEVRNSADVVVFTSNTINSSEFRLAVGNLPSGNYEFRVVYEGPKNQKVNQYGTTNSVFLYHDTNPNYVVSSNIEFDDEIWFPADVIINSGGKLTIKNKANFALGKGIKVNPGGELIADGSLAHLTACDNLWEGINLTSNSKMSMLNGASLSKSNGAIKATDNTIKNNVQILCNGAHFYDNWHHITLRKLTNANISIKGTQFSAGAWALNLDDVQSNIPNGTPVQGNTFANQTINGIVSYNSPISVTEGNEFYGAQYGVNLRNLFGNPTYTLIGDKNQTLPNSFYNCGRAIYSNTGNQEVAKNYFSNNQFGCYYSGNNSFKSIYNNFDNGHAEALYSTGDKTNFSQFNDYNSYEGILTWNNNDKYSFEVNCFNTVWYDVNANGTIATNIGKAPSSLNANDGIAASNCFTGGGVTGFVCNTSHPVTYHLPKLSIPFPLCFTPSGSGYDKPNDADQKDVTACDFFTTPSPNILYQYIANLECNLVALNAIITQLQTSIANLNLAINLGGGTPTQDQANRLNTLRRQLYFALAQKAKCLKKNGSLSDLYTHYKSYATKDGELLAAEVQVLMGQYSAAKSTIDAAQSIYGGNSLIYAAMKLTIRGQYEAYTLTSADIQSLRIVAAMDDTHAAYGRAYLFYLTGESIEPTIVLPPLNPRTKQAGPGSVPMAETFDIAPVPIVDHLSIGVNNFDNTYIHAYTITSMMGVVQSAGVLHSDKLILDTSSWPSGVYVVRISNGKTDMHLQKIIKL